MTDDGLVPPGTSSLEAWICRLFRLAGPCASGEAATPDTTASTCRVGM
ncbi:hypothetical protein [Nonomuraea africana]